LISCQIAGINVVQPLKEVAAFLGAMLIIVLLSVFVPTISLGIPKLLMPSLF
jgi:TRAP-type C4-dicarboxylate transport system permease large subunit